MNGIELSYPALHFFILYFTNKLFAEEVKISVFAMKINQVGTVNSNTKNTKLPPVSTKNANNKQNREVSVLDGSV